MTGCAIIEKESTIMSNTHAYLLHNVMLFIHL